jgi:hypothetical protein
VRRGRAGEGKGLLVGVVYISGMDGTGILTRIYEPKKHWDVERLSCGSYEMEVADTVSCAELGTSILARRLYSSQKHCWI